LAQAQIWTAVCFRVSHIVADLSDAMPCEDGKLRLLNPLSIRFSQPRIGPQFRDGHALDETVVEVYETPLESSPLEEIVPGDSMMSALPTYDAVLVPPFPSIRVISWRPKLRRPDGEAERDAYGDHILGKRAWFALDNRRLHSLQHAAAQRWPKRCCVVVRCIEEVPGTTIRELRKFRTTTEGKSVHVGVHFGATRAWSWVDEVPAQVRASVLDTDVEPDGLFAEDLWAAETWAPQAVAVASGLDGARHGHEEEHMAKVAATRTAAPQISSGGCLGHGIRYQLSACPSSGWQYVDPNGKIQGPFNLDKMVLWHQHGFFYPALPMRCDPSDSFAPFAELWPPGIPPFTIQVKRCSM